MMFFETLIQQTNWNIEEACRSARFSRIFGTFKSSINLLAGRIRFETFNFSFSSFSFLSLPPDEMLSPSGNFKYWITWRNRKQTISTFHSWRISRHFLQYVNDFFVAAKRIFSSVCLRCFSFHCTHSLSLLVLREKRKKKRRRNVKSLALLVDWWREKFSLFLCFIAQTSVRDDIAKTKGLGYHQGVGLELFCHGVECTSKVQLSLALVPLFPLITLMLAPFMLLNSILLLFYDGFQSLADYLWSVYDMSYYFWGSAPARRLCSIVCTLFCSNIRGRAMIDYWILSNDHYDRFLYRARETFPQIIVHY